MNGNPRNISIENFDYPLSAEKIAAYPKPSRDESRLLIYKKGVIGEDIFKNIAAYLPPGSTMILNDTRVVHARILFRKPTGARIEIFCLEPGDEYPDTATAFSSTKSVIWKCMVGRASSWMHQTVLGKKIDAQHTLFARIISKETTWFNIQLSWVPEDVTFAEILDLAGVTPLPPYIKRKPETLDSERYQTVYADLPGSVAAPTAGLHFTPNVFNQLAAASISTAFVTLHVGAGTFKPVKSNTMASHEMHAELIEVKKSLIELLVNNKRSPVIAVGTTSLRTLESLYWIGSKILQNNNVSEDSLQVTQWEPYEIRNETATAEEALNAILQWMTINNKNTLITKTSLLIVPSYTFRLVDILITNFHQPRSTLLLLVAAFIGDQWKSVYTYALENDFRFLSYGDSCLLFRQ